MLTITQGKSVSGTQHYFEEALTRGDYYMGQEVAGRWHGLGVAVLGLAEDQAVTPEQFNQLLEGQHPSTGQQLTQRQRSDRRPGMDLCYSVPKSVSLVWAINGDERILEAIKQSVHETMTRDVEPLMHRRERRGKHAQTKQKTHTGKMIYADFLHKTSRPVDGSPDPHLHVHTFVVNWTVHNGKHYAGEFEEIVRQRPSLQAKFEARLARRLEQELGYRVTRSKFFQSGKLKQGWEIEGITRKTIEKFSRRTQQVEKYADENNITDEGQKATLGKVTRDKKDTGKSIEQLRQEWRSRLTQSERAAFGHLTSAKKAPLNEQERLEQSVQYALDHHLYRQSTAENHQIVGTALEHGLTLKPEDVERELKQRPLIRRTLDADGSKREVLTTREVLQAEQQMIGFVREGRGSRKAMGKEDYRFDRDWLNEQQQDAVRKVLTSRDTVLGIVGGAGTGKSSLMSEAVEALNSYGKQVYTFAPSTGAREVLEDKGFKHAETVQHLIKNNELQKKLRNQVIWIDEAGLLDTQSMNEVFEIAKKQNARVVLSGDARQHASPGRGEPLRLLEQEAGLSVARVNDIQRQKGKYRKAVALISKGSEIVDRASGKTGLLAGFDLLDAMGKIKEISGDDRIDQLATAYLDAVNQKRSTLIVSPTHAEAQAVTEVIRDQLREAGKLKSKDATVTQLRSLNLSNAEKSQVATYQSESELIVQFHQNTPGGIKRGDRYKVLKVRDGSVTIRHETSKDTRELPLTAVDRFEVYSRGSLPVSIGDKIRFSQGGKDQSGKKRISNGRIDEVKKFDFRGNIVLKSGLVIDREYGHLSHGYVVTSHASQGKDVKLAIAAMSSTSLPAINARQFYVSVSRGSEDVNIYVDDKERVRRAIVRSGEELSATELDRAPSSHQEQTREQPSRWQQLARRSYRAARSFRDRVSHWWHSQSETRETGISDLRHAHAGLGSTSFSRFSPTPSRSR